MESAVPGPKCPLLAGLATRVVWFVVGKLGRLEVASEPRQHWFSRISNTVVLGLQKDTPESRPIQLPDADRILAVPEVGGLPHRYERRVA